MEINVLIDNGFADCPDTGWFEDIVEQILAVQSVGTDVEVGLLITNQEKVRQLNREYRDKDEPTDVLTFYMAAVEDKAEAAPFITPPDGVRHLGEVIISYTQAVIQAEEHHHAVRRELVILLVHGVLHLLDYDHEEPEQERGMRAREQEILSLIEPDMD